MVIIDTFLFGLGNNWYLGGVCLNDSLDKNDSSN